MSVSQRKLSWNTPWLNQSVPCSQDLLEKGFTGGSEIYESFLPQKFPTIWILSLFVVKYLKMKSVMI